MMNTRFKTRMTHGALLRRLLACAAITCALFASTAHAQTPGGTQIQNRASATYSDGTNSYSTVSNQVIVTVANVSGLAITPDAGTNPTVVSGQNNVDFTFTVTNTSNFATQVRFLQSGASIVLSGPATVQSAVIDLTNNGLDASDTDIRGNAADVLSASVARNASITVIVRVNINAAAAAGSTVNVRLGDSSGGGPTFDNQTANSSANEVRTSSGASAPVNGESEARGDISATVEADAQLQLSINAPAGPVALGSNITYTWNLGNTGQRSAIAQTLAGAPASSNTGVFVVAPMPVGTSFVSVTPPAGVTMLYSTSPLTNDPLSALTVWTTTPPAPLSTVTRVAYNVGAALPPGAAMLNMQMVVQISSSINASNPIYEIGDAFARNNVNSAITDQSGDNIPNKGDGNANFNEPRLGVDAATATQGFQVPTLLTQVGNVLVGPSGQPAAVGPTDNNDDYTNRSSSVGIAGVAFGGMSTAADTIDFINTVRNTGNANDTFTLTAPTVPAGFTVAISTDGTTFTTVSGGGSTTLALNFGQQANITVRITVPPGSAVLNGFNTVIRARSANTNTSFNDTIDRLYTGFLRLQKSVAIFNTTGVGGATDAVPGAEIEYTITYSNISSTGGTNNVTLTASSIVISEDGNAAPNNWGANTTQVLTTAPVDSTSGVITDGTTNGAVTAATTFLKDSVPSLAPGASGTFKFRRRIN
jgi:hypothetical protein